MNKESNDILSTLKTESYPQGGEKKGIALLFDFGGTLDTVGCHWGKMLWHAYERKGVPVTEEQFRETYVHAERTLGKQPVIQPHYTFLLMLMAKLRIEFEFLMCRGWLSDDKEMAGRMQTSLVNDVYGKVKANIEESRKVLVELKKEHKLGLVTNFYGNMPVVLEEFVLSSLFDTVTESAVVGVRKPDPQIFKLAVESLGVKAEEVVVIGDSYTKDILPAHETGCRTVWLKGEGWTDEDPSSCVADHIIKDLGELLSIIRQYTPFNCVK